MISTATQDNCFTIKFKCIFLKKVIFETFHFYGNYFQALFFVSETFQNILEHCAMLFKNLDLSGQS